ncbi:MAG TPA: CopD family protein [Egibacteraceae bacterium]|nr:CopD family protein [Egibacteraceae bacterium]
MWFALPVSAQLEAPGLGTVAGLWASRLGTYVSFTLLVGLLTAAAWLLRGSAEGSRSALGPSGRTAMRLAAVCAGAWAVSAAGMFFFGLANATARPVTAVFDTPTLGRFLATRYGSGMAVQCAVAIGVCLLAAATRDRTFARVALAGTGAGALALASSGHAATARVPPVAVAADALHILGAAAWVGGLVVLVAFVLRPGHADVVLPARRFSRLAGYALAVVFASGAVNSLMHVERPGQLLDTSWGRLVPVKLVLFAAIASLGWRNRRFLLPRLGTQEAARTAFRKLAAAEVGLMILAFGTATAMAQGVPARVEEAARLEAVRVPFADGQVELTLAPARTGVNELHVYFFDDTGGLREVDDAAVTFVGEATTVEARLMDSGPGHYTGPAVNIPGPGRYRAEVVGEADEQEHTATATFTVR